MEKRIWVPVVGVAVVTAYATLMAMQAAVLDPLEAVPGQSLAQIHAHLARQGLDAGAATVGVAVTAGIGVVLAVGVAVLGIRRRLPLAAVGLMFLALIVSGAAATFESGFALGMDVADAYGVGGGDHTIWAGVLYLTSAAALVGIMVAVAVLAIRPSASPLPPPRPKAFR